MLCNICQDLYFRPWRMLTEDERLVILRSSDEFEEDNENYKDYDNEQSGADDILFYIHHSDLARLQKSADNGCQFCYQLCYGALGRALEAHNEWCDVQGIFLELETVHLVPPDNEQCYRGALTVHLGMKYSGEMRLREPAYDFSNHALTGTSPDRDMTTGSPTNLALASKWLSSCVTSHSNCSARPPEQSMLPSRVIDMGSLRSPQLSLSVGEDRRGSFATLSYCWGKFAERPHYVTTRANITDRMECIDPSILPKTFSDTIFLCRILGIRFLWIDSICIIQGDIDDWKEQSKKMGNIYAQALLNISAAVGIDSNSGLFVSRDPRKTYPCPFTCRYTDKNGSDITAVFLSCLELDANKFGHLDTRGWTFQEMYLPLRTLRFSASGMYWTCTSLNASEALPTGLRPFNHKSDFDRYINRGPEVFGPGHTNISQKYAWWYRAIERYSRRQLTKESDRLEALCGLASVFELGLDDKYLFGIWKADIVRGLAWRVHGKFNDNSERSTQNNSLTQIVPSWSWASRPSKAIIYLSQGLELDANPEIERSLDVEETLPQPRPCFELLSWDCIPPCELRIRGLLLRARHSRKYNSGVFTVLRPDDCSTFWGRPAYDELVDEDDDLYCLPISVDITATAEENYAKLSREELGLVTNEELISEQKELLKYGLIWSGLTWCGDEAPNLKLDRSNRFNCLILRKVDAQEMKFRRVGYVEILDGHCFEGVIPTILYIE